VKWGIVGNALVFLKFVTGGSTFETFQASLSNSESLTCGLFLRAYDSK